jgi:hypothetical protein
MENEHNEYDKPMVSKSKQQGQQVIDAILKEAEELSALSHHDKSGYSVHTNDWVNYTDHSDYSDNSK